MSDFIKNILEDAKIIAIYGASSSKLKDSHKVMQFLQRKGYKVLPINLYSVDEYILGEKIYKKLEDIEIDIDILDVFRPSTEVLEISKKVIHKNIKTVWLQLDIFCSQSKNIIINNGVNFIQNKCTKIEHAKLLNIK